MPRASRTSALKFTKYPGAAFRELLAIDKLSPTPETWTKLSWYCCDTSDLQLCCQGLLSPWTVPPALHHDGPTAPPSHCRAQPASKMLCLLSTFSCWALSEDLKPAETLNVCLGHQCIYTGVACWCTNHRRDTEPQDRVHSPALTQLPPSPHPTAAFCLVQDKKQIWANTTPASILLVLQ